MYVNKFLTNLMFAPPASHETFPQSSVNLWGWHIQFLNIETNISLIIKHLADMVKESCNCIP